MKFVAGHSKLADPGLEQSGLALREAKNPFGQF